MGDGVGQGGAHPDLLIFFSVSGMDKGFKSPILIREWGGLQSWAGGIS
jgi:hypothetical protein